MAKSKWEKFTPEQRAYYLSQQRNKRIAKRKDQQARNMLADFLKAPSAEEKRAVIEGFCPHYFVFGTKLEPQPTKEYENEYA